MPRAQVNGIELEYDVRGEGPPVVLIMGIGAQLVHWPDPFCDLLADRGVTVVRFDNRDAGLSTHMRAAGAPPVVRSTLRAYLGFGIKAPYTLSDMAADTAGLIEALGHEHAHVVGCSMGGMIAQSLAIEHPGRVRSLVSLMSTPGDKRLGRLKALATLLEPVPQEREAAIERSLRIMKVLGSPDYPLDEEAFRAVARAAYDRGVCAEAFARQWVAILASGNRTRRLAAVRAPTLVLHGAEDPLIPVGAGEATARAIPGAELEVIPGMGHDLPRPLWPRLVERIAGHALKHERATA